MHHACGTVECAVLDEFANRHNSLTDRVLIVKTKSVYCDMGLCNALWNRSRVRDGLLTIG